MIRKIYENSDETVNRIYSKIQKKLKEFATENFPSNNRYDPYSEMRKYLLFHILIGSTPMLERIEFFDVVEENKPTIFKFIKEICNGLSNNEKLTNSN